MHIKNTQFKKNFIWNIIGTTFNAFTSLVYMIIVTRVNGLNDAGIFTLGFSTACIIYMIGLYAGRIYQVTESQDGITDQDYIANRAVSCTVALLIGIIFVLVRRYDAYKASIFLILIVYKTIEAFEDVFYGILQKNELLEKVGKSCFYKAVLSIVFFLSMDLLTHNLLFSSFMIVLAFLLMTLFYDYRNAKIFITEEGKPSKNNIISIFRNGFFTFGISFLGLYMTNAPKYAIDSFLSEDMQAIFGIIIMPATVMGLMAQFLIHPFLNQFFDYYKKNEYAELKKLLYKIIMTILLFGVVCCIAGYFLGTQVLGIIYGIDLAGYKICLLEILIGATFYTMAGIISPILVTMRHTRIQFVVYACITLFEMIICDQFVQRFSLNGAVLGYLSTMIIYFMLFFLIAMYIINKNSKEKSKI